MLGTFNLDDLILCTYVPTQTYTFRKVNGNNQNPVYAVQLVVEVVKYHPPQPNQTDIYLTKPENSDLKPNLN